MSNQEAFSHRILNASNVDWQLNTWMTEWVNEWMNISV